MSKQFDYGIASVGLKFPSLALKVEELARIRDIDPAKFTVGLGCDTMALCDKDENAVSLAVGAAERALSRWNGKLSDLGLLVVGSETAADMSRPLSAFVAEKLNLKGALRSYEVKHACYGGTLALRQALEWKQSGASKGKAALVIASDVALYAEKDGGEPTQGAGAVAFIVDTPDIASIDIESHTWSVPAFDFWRPVGESYPRVEGKFSLDCYNEAVENCFKQLVGERDAQSALAEFVGVCFHVPFPKMVQKGVARLTEVYGWDKSQEQHFFKTQIEPTLAWNRLVGNCYTASLWIAVAQQLASHKAGARLAAFSYGSGFGAELFGLTLGPKAENRAWVSDVEQDFAQRKLLSGEAYLDLRSSGKPKVIELQQAVNG